MTTALVFYNMSVVIFFASCFEYAILGCYNLIRMDMYQTSIDYFLLQFQLIFNGAAYVLAVTLLCLQPAEREERRKLRVPAVLSAVFARHCRCLQHRLRRYPLHSRRKHHILLPHSRRCIMPTHLEWELPNRLWILLRLVCARDFGLSSNGAHQDAATVCVGHG